MNRFTHPSFELPECYMQCLFLVMGLPIFEYALPAWYSLVTKGPVSNLKAMKKVQQLRLLRNLVKSYGVK